MLVFTANENAIGNAGEIREYIYHNLSQTFPNNPQLIKTPLFRSEARRARFQAVSRGGSGEGEMVRDTGFESES